MQEDMSQTMKIEYYNHNENPWALSNHYIVTPPVTTINYNQFPVQDYLIISHFRSSVHAHSVLRTISTSYAHKIIASTGVSLVNTMSGSTRPGKTNLWSHPILTGEFHY